VRSREQSTLDPSILPKIRRLPITQCHGSGSEEILLFRRELEVNATPGSVFVSLVEPLPAQLERHARALKVLAPRRTSEIGRQTRLQFMWQLPPFAAPRPSERNPLSIFSNSLMVFFIEALGPAADGLGLLLGWIWRGLTCRVFASAVISRLEVVMPFCRREAAAVLLLVCVLLEASPSTKGVTLQWGNPGALTTCMASLVSQRMRVAKPRACPNSFSIFFTAETLPAVGWQNRTTPSTYSKMDGIEGGAVT
jgi:hypothetical protein